MRSLVLVCLALALVACSSSYQDQEANFVETDTSGSVRIPLLGTAQDGTTYRLEGAVFEISGSAMATVNESDARNAEELVAQLPAGGYSLFLRPGFKLIAVQADGTTSTASNAVAVKNPLAFDVADLGNPALKLEFQADGKDVVFGGGGAVRMSRAELDAI